MAHLFRDVPAKRLTDCCDWKVVVSGYTSNDIDDDDDDLEDETKKELEA